MATYHVDGAVGSNSNDGLSEGAGGAWLTISHAATQVAANDTVYIKGSTTYSEDVTLTTAGNSTSPIIWIGYGTTKDDNGMITITPTASGFSSALASMYNYFFNIHVTGGSSHGWSAANGDNCIFFNCKSTNNGGRGFNMDNNTDFIRCTSSGNGDTGIWTDFNSLVAFTKVFSNTPQVSTDGQVRIGSGNLINTLVYGSTDASGVGGNVSVGIYNTLDGEGTILRDGMDSLGTGVGTFMCNLVHDYDDGIAFNTGNDRRINMFNMFTSLNGSNYINGSSSYQHGLGDIATASPDFTDEAGDDYTINTATSQAYQAGPTIGSD